MPPYVPAPRISFELPETAYVGVNIPVTATSSNAKTVTWTLSKDGTAVQLEDGALNEAGGTLSFAEVGTYTLRAVAANSRGRTETVVLSNHKFPEDGQTEFGLIRRCVDPFEEEESFEQTLM